MRQIFANLHPYLWLNELFKEATGLVFSSGMRGRSQWIGFGAKGRTQLGAEGADNES